MNTKAIEKMKTAILWIVIVIIIMILLYTAIKYITIYKEDKASTWHVHQTHFIQYLYYTNRCISLADDHQIEIDSEFREEIELHTNKLFKKLNIKNLIPTQITQLIWLDHYYDLGQETKLYKKLDEFYNEDMHMFRDILIENTEDVCDTYLLYDILKDVPSFDYNIYPSFANYIEDENAHLGEIVYLSNILYETGNSHLINVDDIFNQLKPDIEKDILYSTFIDGTYEVSAAYVSDSIDFAKFFEYFGDDYSYSNLGQEFYNKIQTIELAEYYISDDLANLIFYISYKGVDDLKQNPFISSNLNNWLIENYHLVIRSEMLEAFN